MDIKKNRKVTYIAPVRAVHPRNDRFEAKRERAFTRLTLWLTATMFASCAATAPMYARLFLTDAPRLEGVILWWMLVTLIAGYAADKTVAAWNEACRMTERLGRRDEALALIRRDLH